MNFPPLTSIFPAPLLVTTLNVPPEMSMFPVPEEPMPTVNFPPLTSIFPAPLLVTTLNVPPEMSMPPEPFTATVLKLPAEIPSAPLPVA